MALMRERGRTDGGPSYAPGPAQAPQADGSGDSTLASLILQHSSELIALINDSGTYRYVSPSHARILGYSPADLLDRSCSLIIHPEDAPIGRERWAAARSNGQARLVCRVARRSGDWAWVDVRIERIAYAGEPLALLIGHDITELHQREAQLVAAQRTLLVGSMASGVAHDLNNLLAVVEASASLAADSLPADHSAQEDLEAISQASRRSSGLTRQLVAFVRQQPLNQRPLLLGEICHSSRQLIERLAGRGVAVAITVAPDIWPVLADRSQIEQILINLVVNARDAMPEGGQIDIDAANQPAGDVRISVRDQGVGMSPEVQRRLFEPFFSTKAPGKGVGLGLATCQYIVEGLGGRIEVASASGAGSTFSVYLPRHQG
jgi:PAS domain S-box-containing protein